MSEKHLHLVVEDGGVFRFESGSREDWNKLLGWCNYYHTRKDVKPLSVDEMIEVVELLSRLIEGTEHGVYSGTSFQRDAARLTALLREKGYMPFGRWTNYEH